MTRFDFLVLTTSDKSNVHGKVERPGTASQNGVCDGDAKTIRGDSSAPRSGDGALPATIGKGSRAAENQSVGLG